MKEIIEMIGNYGIPVVISGMVLYFAYSFGKIYLEKMKSREVDIKDHPLFSYMKHKVEYEIDTLSIGDECRTAVFRKFLKVKFGIFLRNLKAASKEDLCDISNDKLEKKLFKTLTGSIVEYEKELKEIGMPDFVIERFNTWHLDHVNVVSDGLKNICHNDYFGSNTTKLAVIFEVYKVGFELTILDAKRSLSELNGQLSRWCKENPETMSRWKNF